MRTRSNECIIADFFDHCERADLLDVFEEIGDTEGLKHMQEELLDLIDWYRSLAPEGPDNVWVGWVEEPKTEKMDEGKETEALRKKTLRKKPKKCKPPRQDREE